MNRIGHWMEKAKEGGSVYLYQVKEVFDQIGDPMSCVLETMEENRVFVINIPEPRDEEERQFVATYFYARIYNIISILGGVKMTVYASGDHVLRLAGTLDDVFGVQCPRGKRTGYAKCLNVADRSNIALGGAPFCFDVKQGSADASLLQEDISGGRERDVIRAFRQAVEHSGKYSICGMDVGGTDIKIATTRKGKIHHIKEYDWFPAAFIKIEDIIDTVELMARLSAGLVSLPEEVPEEVLSLKNRLLEKDATMEEIQRGVQAIESFVGEVFPLDGIGLSFPDVVVRNMIVGGETHKTKGVRDHSQDYETELRKLTDLNQRLQRYCRKGGVVRIANDGSMAAYTAAVELACSDRAAMVQDGIFAHTLGTELGTGWINEAGEVPEIPLEVYNCIIDIGNRPAQSYQPRDVRSLNNYNTGLAGTLQKYTSQSGAFRLAEQYYKAEAPELYRELFDLGFLTDGGEGGLEVAMQPCDMRKPFLEHLMAQAEAKVPAAVKIFEKIGTFLAATWLETETILGPAVKSRALFGRFVKRNACFECMYRGAQKTLADIRLFAADDQLAFTPLMCALRDDPEYSVAQFGQAVGGIHFAASELL